jgi:hypothetical protein
MTYRSPQVMVATGPRGDTRSSAIVRPHGEEKGKVWVTMATPVIVSDGRSTGFGGRRTSDPSHGFVARSFPSDTPPEIPCRLVLEQTLVEECNVALEHQQRWHSCMGVAVQVSPIRYSCQIPGPNLLLRPFVEDVSSRVSASASNRAPAGSFSWKRTLRRYRSQGATDISVKKSRHGQRTNDTRETGD